jgi:hypothetical protein
MTEDNVKELRQIADNLRGCYGEDYSSYRPAPPTDPAIAAARNSMKAYGGRKSGMKEVES